ncbi:oligosaccharide flippase family protein [Lysinibacillus sp. SGAir0095]|uniref:oligosaccharide flippase family protein n=1 Tax=Lysinibacillus sp. SGAir0095 TaxID=2070463 RepID=UPI0010CCD540|nr:oligosaccharide flippase family protein [Lysinibacillus sp. SGAir0095]QCR31888.1 hypothetical protein C1N55_06715 [Lysinibacillus sp. SGAir0095]
MNKIFKESFWLIFGTVLGTFLTFFTQVLLTRFFNVEEYGSYITAMNLINLFAVFVSFGVGDFLVKIFGEEGDFAYRWIKPNFLILTYSLVFSLLILLLIIIFSEFSETTKHLLLYLIPNIILQGLLPLITAIYQIEQNYNKVALYNLVIYIVRFLGVILAIIYFDHVIYIGLITCILSIITIHHFIKILFRLQSKSLRIPNYIYKKRREYPNLLNSLKNSSPYGLAAIFYFIYYQSDIILLSFFKGEEIAGYYNVAFTIISFVYLFPNIIFGKLFLPKLHFWVHHNPKMVKSLYKKSNLIMIIVGLLSVILIMFTAEVLISLVFGERYIDSAQLLILLSLCIPFRFICSVSGTIMSTDNRIYSKVKHQGLTAVLNILLNIILIPYIGVYGAVYSTILCEVFLFILLWNSCKNYIKLIV